MSEILVNSLKTAGGVGSLTFDSTGDVLLTTGRLGRVAGNTITIDSDGILNAASVNVSSAITLPAGAIDSAAIGTGAVKANKLDIGQIGGRRNLIINGAMQVAQRGTSSTSGGTNGYHALDRWFTQANSVGSWTVSQESDAPDGFSYSMKYLCTSGFTQVAQTRLLPIYYFEGQDVQQLKYGTSDAQPITLSFWVKCNKTGVGQVNARNVDANRIVGGTYTVDSANTWEYKTITFPGDTVSSITNDNTVGLWLEWWLVSGSDFDTGAVPTSYEFRNNADRDAAGTLDLDATDDYWQITGVQLEVGDVATPFEHRSYGEELALCQRYYYGVNSNTAAGTNTFGLTTWYYNSTSARTNIQFPVTMRSNPSLDASLNTAFRIYRNNGNETADGNDMSIDVANVDFMTIAIGNVSSTQGSVGGLQIRHGDGGYLNFSAEL